MKIHKRSFLFTISTTVLSLVLWTLPVHAETIDITGATNYDSATMKGNTLNLTAGSSLTSNDTTYPIATSCTLTGSGDWIVNNAGNVYYTGNSGTDAAPKVAPTLSNYTGTIYIGNQATRWMAGQTFYTQFGSGTIDVKGKSQVWLNGTNSVLANFHLHDPIADGEAAAGSIRFDQTNGNIKGNIELDGAGQTFRIGVRLDGKSATNTISGVISGTGNLHYGSFADSYQDTKSTLVLTATNTYEGTTLIEKGKLELQGAGTVGLGDITLTKYTGTKGMYDGTLVINKAAGNDYTLTQAIKGTGFIEQKGAASTTFSGSLSDFTGGITQSAGTVTFSGSATALGSGSSYTQTGGTVNLGTLTSLGTYNYTAGTINAGTNPVTVGTVNVTGSIPYSTLTSAFNSTTTNVNAGGTITVTNSTDWQTLNSKVNFNGGTVTAAKDSDYIINSDLTVKATATVSPTAYLNVPTTKTATVTVNDGVTATFTKGLSEQESATGQSLVKDGTGTLTLEGPISYTGTTTVKAGQMNVLGITMGSTTSKVTVEKDAIFRTTQQYSKKDKDGVPNFVFAGSGTVWFEKTGDGSSEVLSLTNPYNFNGTIKLTGKLRFRSYNLGNFKSCTFDVSNGAQFWTDYGGNLPMNFTIDGGTSNYDGRGNLRFDFSALAYSGEGTSKSATLPVLTGTFTTTNGFQISTIQSDNAGVGLISGKITGSANLTKNENYAIESNPLNARLILTGTNDYSGTTTIKTGTLQLGHVGTVNGTAYDGTTGTLGTGKLIVEAPAAMDYCRVNTYDFQGGIENQGQINVNSGTFKTSGTNAVTNTSTGKISVANGAVYETAGTLTNEGQITVAEGGTVYGSGTITVNSGSTFTFASGSTLAVGAAGDTQGKTLTFTGKQSLIDLGSASLVLDFFDSTNYDSIVQSGQLKTQYASLVINTGELDPMQVYSFKTGLEGLSFANMSLSGTSGNWQVFVQGDKTFFGEANNIPEPATWVLLMLGMVMIYKKARR